MSSTAATPPIRDRIEPARLPVRELIGAAFQGLRTRRLRAALSALGIAIGIGAMVAVVGVSSSSQAQLLAEIDSLGTNLLTASPGTTFTGGNEVLPTTSVPMIARMPNVLVDPGESATYRPGLNLTICKLPLVWDLAGSAPAQGAGTAS